MPATKNNQNTSNRQIAKNSLFLYIRTAITMVISLYSSRVILQELGVENYGIYNIVGGIVILLSSLSGTLAGATQRYITFAIGKEDTHFLRSTFSTSLRIHLYLALGILIIAETAGIWFLNNKINLPEGRLLAASIVFQFSALGFIINTITLPYESIVIAKEKFNFYAMIDICRVILKLALVLCIGFLPYDSLIVYGSIELMLIVFHRGMYIMYTKRNFKEIRYTKEKNKKLYSEMLHFTGWNFLGTVSSVFYSQGSSIILNVYYGVVLNAAMGISHQVRATVNTFITNFTMAVNPQITKSYAQNDTKRTNDLMFLSSKISASLLFIIGFPLVLNIDYVLNIWLNTVPEYTTPFVLLSLCALLIGAFTIPFNCLIFATGKIKYYQISCVIINVVGLIALYFLFEYKFGPYVIFYVLILQSILKVIVLLIMSGRATLFPVSRYIYQVILKVFAILALIITSLNIKRLYLPETDLVLFITETIACIAIALIIIIFFIFSSKERCAVLKMFKSKIRK